MIILLYYLGLLVFNMTLHMVEEVLMIIYNMLYSHRKGQAFGLLFLWRQSFSKVNERSFQYLDPKKHFCYDYSAKLSLAFSPLFFLTIHFLLSTVGYIPKNVMPGPRISMRSLCMSLILLS